MSAQAQRTGARVEYHGQGAGLGRIERGGDTSSPYNYVLFCQCNAQLGPLGAWKADKLGRRAIACPYCQHAIIVGAEAQILKVCPVSEILAMQKATP